MFCHTPLRFTKDYANPQKVSAGANHKSSHQRKFLAFYTKRCAGNIVVLNPKYLDCSLAKVRGGKFSSPSKHQDINIFHKHQVSCWDFIANNLMFLEQFSPDASFSYDTVFFFSARNLHPILIHFYLSLEFRGVSSRLSQDPNTNTHSLFGPILVQISFANSCGSKVVAQLSIRPQAQTSHQRFA